MSKYYLTTTGKVNPLILNDLNLSYPHPTSHHDLLLDVSLDKILSSDDLKFAVETNRILLKDENGKSINLNDIVQTAAILAQTGSNSNIDLFAYQNKNEKNQPNGYLGLDNNSKFLADKILQDANNRLTNDTEKSIWNAKQDSLGFNAENISNKDPDSSFTSNSDSKYPSQKAVKTAIDSINSTLSNSLSSKQSTSEKNQPNGYAGLDNNGLLSITQLVSLADLFKKQILFRDDFISSTGGFSSSMGVSFSSYVSEINKIGIIKVQNAGNTTVHYNSSIQLKLGGGSKRLIITCKFKLDTLFTPSQDGSIKFGLAGVGGTSPSFTNGTYFEYTRSTSVNWLGSTSANTTTQSNSNNIVDLNWHEFTIDINLNASIINFYIDTNLVGTNTTDIPLNVNLTPVIACFRTSGIADIIYEIDDFYVYGDR